MVIASLSKKQLTVIATIVVILSISIPLLTRPNNDFVVEEYIGGINSSIEEYAGSLDADLFVNNSEFYKGQNIPVILELSVSELSAWIGFLEVNITLNGREAAQSVLVNQTFQPGAYNVSLELSPGFSSKGFVALNYGDYIISSFSISYQQRYEEMQILKTINYPINIHSWPKHEGMKNVIWNINQTTTEVSISRGSPTNITLDPIGALGSISMISEINTTGFTQLNYTITGAVLSNVSLSFNNTFVKNSQSSGVLTIGNLKGNQTLVLNATLVDSEVITIQLSMTTMHNPIFVVNADNNWGGTSTDRLTFNPPDFYVNQASSRFENTFNISFIEVAHVPFKTDSSSSLANLIIDAINGIGKSLTLTNNSWTASSGPQATNFGADIMLIFTNKTMQHLGVVIGAYGEAFNMAVQARGSNFEGNYRILSTMADNLIQHEVSHIFGAPDRWTATDEASIMSKSEPEDATLDIIFGRFWLLRTNWLEEDIQKMISKSVKFLE